MRVKTHLPLDFRGSYRRVRGKTSSCSVKLSSNSSSVLRCIICRTMTATLEATAPQFASLWKKAFTTSSDPKKPRGGRATRPRGRFSMPSSNCFKKRTDTKPRRSKVRNEYHKIPRRHSGKSVAAPSQKTSFDYCKSSSSNVGSAKPKGTEQTRT